VLLESGFRKTSKIMNAAKQIMVSHHGLKGIGNKMTIIHVHQGQDVFLVVSGSTFDFSA